MGRTQRISFPGALFHVTVRGNNREKIFVEEKDYMRYLKIVKERKDEFGFCLYAYVLMPNHVHLLLQVGEKADISKIMQAINTAYTKYFTIKYKRVGHLFQGRFHSVLVDKDEYLLVLTLYIHLNPVRAALVSCPSDFKWSSCSNYLKGDSDSFLDFEEVFAILDTDPEEQRKIYEKLLKIEMSQKERQKYLKERLSNSLNVIGSEQYIDKLTAMSGTK